MSYENRNGDRHEESGAIFSDNNKGAGFSHRLKQSMQGKGIRELCKETGISYGAMQKYLAGSAVPKLDNLVLLSEKTGVDIAWLATGNEKKASQAEPQMPADPMELIIGVLYMLDPEEKELLAKLLARKGVETILYLLSEDNITLLQQPSSLKTYLLKKYVTGKHKYRKHTKESATSSQIDSPSTGGN